MKNENTLTDEKRCWALLDQLVVALVAAFDPSGTTPFSLSIDSPCRNRINQWIGRQNIYLIQNVFSGLLQQFTCNNELEEQKPPSDKRLQKIYKYVHSHYSVDIRLQKLASLIGMTEPAFSRFFKKTTGKQFSSYLNKVRIDYAARQLLETGDSVSEIGYGCGFNTINYFIHIFKKLKGCTPGEYRKIIEN